VQPFKGIFCDDISEFESYMPSQAVRSLCARRKPWLPVGNGVPARRRRIGGRRRRRRFLPEVTR
jgi:hypothetical protein